MATKKSEVAAAVEATEVAAEEEAEAIAEEDSTIESLVDRKAQPAATT